MTDSPNKGKSLEELIARARRMAHRYAEISPYGGCNHRCTFCAPDFMGYQPVTLDAAVLRVRLQEMARLGLKSALFAGEGEPCLHREIGSLITEAAACGLDVALTTLHQATGAAILALSVVVMLWTYRLLAPRKATRANGSA